LHERPDGYGDDHHRAGRRFQEAPAVCERPHGQESGGRDSRPTQRRL